MKIKTLLAGACAALALSSAGAAMASNLVVDNGDLMTTDGHDVALVSTMTRNGDLFGDGHQGLTFSADTYVSNAINAAGHQPLQPDASAMALTAMTDLGAAGLLLEPALSAAVPLVAAFGPS